MRILMLFKMDNEDIFDKLRLLADKVELFEKRLEEVQRNCYDYMCALVEVKAKLECLESSSVESARSSG